MGKYVDANVSRLLLARGKVHEQVSYCSLNDDVKCAIAKKVKHECKSKSAIHDMARLGPMYVEME